MILYNLASRDGDRERAFHRSLLRKRTDGLIAVGVDFTSPEREQLLSVGHPIIAIGGPVPGIRNIGVDDRAVARLATEHLIGLGHRDILHLGGADDEGLNKRLPVDRRQGFLDAMEAAGLPGARRMAPDWKVLCPRRARGDGRGHSQRLEPGRPRCSRALTRWHVGVMLAERSRPASECRMTCR